VPLAKGDVSFLSARSKEDAIIMLDEWDNALKRILPELVVSKQKLRQAEGSCIVRLKGEEGSRI